MIRNDLEFLRLDAALEAVAVARALVQKRERRWSRSVWPQPTQTDRIGARSLKTPTYEKAVRCLEEQTREREAGIARLEGHASTA